MIYTLYTVYGNVVLSARCLLLDVFILLSVQNYPSFDLDIRNLADIEFDTLMMFSSMRKNTAIMMQQIQEELEKLTSVGNNSLMLDSN